MQIFSGCDLFHPQCLPESLKRWLPPNIYHAKLICVLSGSIEVAVLKAHGTRLGLIFFIMVKVLLTVVAELHVIRVWDWSWWIIYLCSYYMAITLKIVCFVWKESGCNIQQTCVDVCDIAVVYKIVLEEQIKLDKLHSVSLNYWA